MSGLMTVLGYMSLFAMVGFIPATIVWMIVDDDSLWYPLFLIPWGCCVVATVSFLALAQARVN